MTDLNMGSANRFHVAFLFEKEFLFPPSIDNMKVFYISRELLRRGARVSWVQFRGNQNSLHQAGIEFVTIPIRSNIDPLRRLLTIFHILAFCLSTDVRCVYIDEWLMFRSEGFWQLILRAALKVSRLKIVFDLRDPYIDYQLAYGTLRKGSRRHSLLLLEYSLIYRLTDLIVLPSQVYADLYVREGVPANRVIGVPRGIDTDLFNPSAYSRSIKSNLGLDGKFIVGWFGMMHRYRQIDAVLIPIIRNIQQYIPCAHVLIGGKGDLLEHFTQLKNEDPDAPFTLLGLVPYDKLPRYIAACDVLLAPIDPSFRFTRHSVWLKILESLAIGKPIVATRTRLSVGDFKNLKGIIWTGSDVNSFIAALIEVHDKYLYYSSLASEQASNFHDYSVRSTIPRVVDRIENLL